MKIIRDTREKDNFEWSFGEIYVEEKKLETGDYTLVGMEDKVCIERKHSPSELAVNVGIDSARFNRELVRMSKIPYAYIICEFTLSSLIAFPKGSKLPPSQLAKVKINGKFLVQTLNSYYSKYGVQVIYAGDRDSAINKTIDIFETVLKLEGSDE